MSYRKIFSVVNELTASTVTARYAILLAAACKAELVFYAAPEEGIDAAVRHHTERHLEHLLTVASDLGISATRITEIGSIGTLLPERVQTEQADLVIYPLTPHKRDGTDLQRQMVQHLLQAVRSDLAIVRVVSMAKPHPGNILAPLDRVIGNRERLLAFITMLARSSHAQVTLYHLFRKRDDAKGMPDDITLFGKQLRQQQVTVLERSGRGDPGKAINVEAITRHNDLIVVGASGRGAMRRLIFGNPAGDIMHQPPCNAILFRVAP